MTQPQQEPPTEQTPAPSAGPTPAQPQGVPPGYPPPGYPPYPPPGYPPYGYPPPPLNTYAVLSLVLALALFPPLGIYFGIKAKEQIAQTGERGLELARVGVIAGWVLTGLMVLFFVLWCGFMATVASSS